MSLVRFDPFLRDIDRLFEAPITRLGDGWMPRVDVFDKDDALVVRAEVAGVDADSIEVTVEGGTLKVAGSRSFETEARNGAFHRKEIFEGSFARTVLLPEGMDADAVKAAVRDGILEVTIPRRPEVLPRRISVEVTH